MEMTTMELYKACKYQVEEYYRDHGMTLPEMWDVVHGNGSLGSKWQFWLKTVLDDYREYLYNMAIGIAVTAFLSGKCNFRNGYVLFDPETNKYTLFYNPGYQFEEVYSSTKRTDIITVLSNEIIDF